MGTKNNPANRGQSGKGKTYDNKPVKPVRYIGTHVGHGKYIAAQYDNGQMVVDQNGKPIPWDAI